MTLRFVFYNQFIQRHQANLVSKAFSHGYVRCLTVGEDANSLCNSSVNLKIFQDKTFPCLLFLFLKSSKVDFFICQCHDTDFLSELYYFPFFLSLLRQKVCAENYSKIGALFMSKVCILTGFFFSI